jgi:hypothetical protein
MKKSTNSGPVPGMARKSNIFDIFSVLDLNPNKKKKTLCLSVQKKMSTMRKFVQFPHENFKGKIDCVI